MKSLTPGKIIRASLIPALALLLVVSTASAAPLPQDRPQEDSGEKAAESKAQEDSGEKAAESKAQDDTKPAEKPVEKPTEIASAADSEEDTDDAPLRFTNEDLPQTPPMYRAGAETDETDKADARGGKGRRGQKADEKKDVPASAEVDERALQAQRHALQQRAVELQERIAYLEARLFALRNPLYRGRTPSHDDEEDAVGGRSNFARVEWVEQQIDAARSELENTRAELLTLSRR